MMRRYYRVLYGQRGWRKVLEKYRVTAAIVDLGSQCTVLLRTAPEWELVYEDRMNAIFFRRDAPGGQKTGWSFGDPVLRTHHSEQRRPTSTAPRVRPSFSHARLMAPCGPMPS